MIQGTVKPTREAIIPLTVRGPGGACADIEAVIDTGFTESLSVPPALVASLALSYLIDVPMVLADGSVTRLRVFNAMVVWDGQEILVRAHEADGDPLVGMSLLYGCDVHLQVVDGGAVTISRLP